MLQLSLITEILNNTYENPSICSRIKAKNRQIDDSQIGFVNNYELKLNNKTLFKPPQKDKKHKETFRAKL